MANKRAVNPRDLDRRTDTKSGIWLAVFLLGFLVVNIASAQTEHVRNGLEFPFARTVFMECSAGLSFIASIPLIAYSAGRFPPGAGNWKATVPIHIGLSLCIALTILLMMISVRKVFSPILLDASYVFGGDWIREVFYEYRKIALFYMSGLFIMVLGRQIADSQRELKAMREETKRTHEITLKTNGRTVRLDAGSIIRIRSEANYLNIETQDSLYFVRGTLGQILETLEGAGLNFLRVHRSHLVNVGFVDAIRPDGQGGLKLTMSDEGEVPCSRSYRARVEHLFTNLARNLI